MHVNAVSAPKSASESNSSLPAGPRSDTPALPNDALFYGAGLEFVASLLASRSAESTLKLAKKVQREAKIEQAAELEAQATATRDKASAMRSQALWSGTATIAGGAMNLGGAATYGDKQGGTRLAQALSAGGQAANGLSQPVGTLTGGARATELEATSMVHSSRAKQAEGLGEEFATLEKQARSIIDKSTSIMQSLVQERQAVMRSILRAG